MANHIRVMVSIVLAQLIVLYLGLQIALPLILLGVAPIFFKSEDFMAFITWQLFFVVLVSDVIMASNDMPLSR